MRKYIERKKETRGYTLWVIVSLAILGAAAIAGRLTVSDQFDVPRGDTVWEIAINVQIPAASKEDRILLSPPWDTKNSRVIAQQLSHAGMRFVRGRSDSQNRRDIDLKVTTEGSATLRAEFTTHLSNTPIFKGTQTTTSLSLEQRAEYLGSSNDIHMESPAVTRTLKNISARTKDKTRLANNIFDFVHEKIIKDKRTVKDDHDTALKTGRASTLGRARTLVALSRAAEIPARIVTGFILEESINVTPYHWVELFQETGWVPYDPERGYAGSLPANFLPFNRGGENIVNSKNAVTISYDIEQGFDFDSLNLSPDKKPSDILNLKRFSPSVRDTLAIILLLPFGALITALVRTLLGVRCYGTFTPTLIALAAAYADWVVAVVLLAVVIALGMTGRTIIPGKLSRVPRLSIVFTIVAMSMAMGVSLMEYFDYSQNASVVLLPTVILTTLIDRFYSATDEYGIKLAVRRLVWTMVIAAICYSVFVIDALGYFLLTFPEMHFFTLAAILLLSLYKAKNISNIPYLTWLAEPKIRNRRARDPKPEDDL